MKLHFSKTPASALLITFFLMALLITAGIGVSTMVLSDVVTVRTVVGGAQARYAAEGMAEYGLKILKDKLPGYEVLDEIQTFKTGAEGFLTIAAREAVVPCSVNNDDEGEAVWRRLAFNESVQLPLFAETDTGQEKIDQFYVEFYLGDSEGNPVLDPIFQNVDVLRWKILGLLGDNTEAISEFIPIDGVNTTPENPTLFGSDPNYVINQDYFYAKYYALDSNGNSYTFFPHYPILDFLRNHEFNYLVMTNVVQVTSPSPENFFIYFKLHSTVPGVDAVCEFVDMDTVGDATYGEARQSVETVVKEGENLPVYDFVLYHTSGEIVEAPLVPVFDLDFDPFTRSLPGL